MTRNTRWIHARGNSANVFSSLVSIRPRDIHPPTRRAIHRDAVIKHGGAHEFRRATRKKEKKEKWKEEKEKKKKGEIKRIKDAQFNRAIAIFRKSYDFLFRLFRSSLSLPPLRFRLTLAPIKLSGSLLLARAGFVFGGRIFKSRFSVIGRWKMHVEVSRGECNRVQIELIIYVAAWMGVEKTNER